MHTARLLIGSFVVYVLVACGSAVLENSSPSDGGDRMLDALAHPTPDALAQSVPPITATESCSTMVPTSSAVVETYAVHSFPGFSAQQLAAVQTLGTLTNAGQAGAPSGFGQMVGFSVYVRDGSVAVYCGVASGPAFQSVTFILPQ